MAEIAVLGPKLASAKTLGPKLAFAPPGNWN